MKILLVIDMQKDFIDGSLGTREAVAILPKVLKKMDTFEGKILATRDTHGEDYLSTQEGRKLPVVHCLKGTDGWQLYGRVADLCSPQDRCFEKVTFGSLDLAEYVKEQKFDQIELVGLVSNICVISNAVLCKAAVPEAEILVDAGCTGSGMGEIHQKALDVMEGLQITVTGRKEEDK